MVIKYPKIIAPITIVRIIVVDFNVSINASWILLKLYLRISNPTIKVAKAPKAPASVGVTLPAYIPPIPIITITKVGQMLFNELHFSLMDAASFILGAISGFIFTRITIVATYPNAVITPGIIPAISNCPTPVSVVIPYSTNPTLGRSMTARVPQILLLTIAHLLLYLSIISPGQVSPTSG